MEAKWTKVLDNGNRIVVKQIPEGRTWDSNRSGLKRKRFNDCETKCTTCLKKSSLKNYSNFMESGLPNRVLFYENNEWIDFPPTVVELIREHFVLKNAAIEVKFNECHYLLDILYMIKCDLRSGVQKHIGWIDEAGVRFFPDVGTHHSGQTKLVREGGLILQIPEGDREIKLELQIDIGGTPVSDLEGCVEESNSPSKRIKIRRKIVGHDYDDERIDDDQESLVKVEVAVEGGRDGSEEVANRVRPAIQPLNLDTVKKTFISGMSALAGCTEVVGVTACSRHLMQTQLEVFEKQVEITKDRRGDANVKYAWLAADKDALRSVMVYGVGAGAGGFSSMFQSSSGLHLSPINLPYISASKCVADQSGMRHVVLCRVILGKVEQILPGSEQVLPSDANYDSGVDCLHNPCLYFVWSMNTSTHICPEYIVSFRTESQAEDGLLLKESKNGVLERAAGQVFKGEMQLQRSPEGNSSPLLNSVKSPKSPWMPFPLLFDAISKEVASKEMTEIYAHYDLFMKKMIRREDFISRLRMIVGDELLRSTLLNLQGKRSLRFQSRSMNAEAFV